MEEKIYYQDQNVMVSNTRFVNGGKTYAMRNISSVQMGTIEPKGIGGLVFVIIIGIIMLIFGGTNTKILGGMGIGFSLIILFTSKPSYSVRINSNAGEVDGLVSKDQVYIQTIVKAINDAIVNTSY